MEDRALMYALGELTTTVDKMRGTHTNTERSASGHVRSFTHLTSRLFAEEVHSLLKALLLFQFDKQAEKLQLAYDEALQMMEAAVPEVWPEDLHHSQAPVNEAQSYFKPGFRFC